MGEEAGEEGGGGLLGVLLVALTPAGHPEEGLAGGGGAGDEGTDLGELAGAAAVLEGVEVAAGRASTGAGAAATGISRGFSPISRR